LESLMSAHQTTAKWPGRFVSRNRACSNRYTQKGTPASSAGRRLLLFLYSVFKEPMHPTLRDARATTNRPPPLFPTGRDCSTWDPLETRASRRFRCRLGVQQRTAAPHSQRQEGDSTREPLLCQPPSSPFRGELNWIGLER
jgi:hypothetical protein